MKRILQIVALFITASVFSQQITFEKQVSAISKNIEMITKQEKDSLKTKVMNINKRLDKGEITSSTAALLKKEVAAYHARKIERLVGEQEQLLQQLVQDKTNGKIASSDDIKENEDEENTFSIGNKTFRFTVDDENSKERSQRRNEKWESKRNRNRATTSQFVFAMGFNNVLVDNTFSSLENSNYKFWESHFYEVGWTWKTRFSRKPSQLYLKYGISFLWNNLRLEENQLHVKNGNITEIQTSSESLSESRLRHVQMNFPLHIEWDLSKNSEYKDGQARDRRNKSVRLGIGGVVGFKLGTRQYLEYDDISGVAIEEVQYDNFNMHKFNYGVSGYLGYRSFSLYVKYDLNPLFKNTEVRNISMGIRLDLE
jgi:hypothetical protein